MPFSLRTLSRSKLIAFCFVAVFGIAAWGVTYRPWGHATKATSHSLPHQRVEAAANPDRLVVQELLTLRRSGFDPAELTIPSGNFLLAVDNLSGIPDIQLTLAEEKKNKLKDIKFASRNRDWREEIDLKPGVYILSVLSHPTWTCRITVTEQTRSR